SPTPRSDFAPGTIVAERFSIETVLGRGAMGTVYRARHLWLDAPVALKILHPHLVDNDFANGRLLEEARAVAKLKSEHVVRMLDSGRTADGSVYLAMEYVAGQDLEVEMRELIRLPQVRAVRIARDVCAALTEAHARGIVHRDLKPENLLIERGIDGIERIKVGDFGIAKRLHLGGGRKLTLDTQPVGTPCYMAPEQILDATRVDARADIFSLGVVLYELLSGYLPFGGGNTTEIYAATLHGEPLPLEELVPEIDPELERIILRCLAKDPGARFADASELAEALEHLPCASERVRSGIRAGSSPGSSRDAMGEECPPIVSSGALATPALLAMSQRSSADPVHTTLISADAGALRGAGRWRRGASVGASVALVVAMTWGAVLFGAETFGAESFGAEPSSAESSRPRWLVAVEHWVRPRAIALGAPTLARSSELVHQPRARELEVIWPTQTWAEPELAAPVEVRSGLGEAWRTAEDGEAQLDPEEMSDEVDDAVAAAAPAIAAAP
ncbi:MAG TPA: serine/threonine-protein kinase, partial [Polyangiaceae bacterium]|nr:serine/threonine-protein kinase [Polyangiaceae bacterium]